MKDIKIIVLFFLLTLLASCSQNKKSATHESLSTISLSLNSDVRHFNQYTLSITSIDLISDKNTHIPLLGQPQSVDFSDNKMPMEWLKKQIPSGKYIKIAITINMDNAKISQPIAHESEGISDIHLSLKDGINRSIPQEASDFNLVLDQDMLLEPNTQRNFLLHFEAGRSLASPHEPDSESRFIFSPVFSFSEISDANFGYIFPLEDPLTLEIPEEKETAQIYSIKDNLIVIKMYNQLQELDLNTVRITSSSDNNLVLSRNNLHEGQFVSYTESEGELELYPSGIIAEAPLLSLDAAQSDFKVLLINELPFPAVFNRPTLRIDHTDLNSVGFEPPEGALLGIQGYIDTFGTPTLKATDYYYVALDDVNFSITFPENKTITMRHEEKEGDIYLSFTKDSLEESTSLISIKDVNIPLHRTIEKIKISKNGLYNIRLQSDNDIAFEKYYSDDIIQELQNKLASEWSFSSLDITGSFDIKTQELSANNILFTLKPTAVQKLDGAPQDQVISSFVADSSEKIVTNTIIITAAITAGMFGIAATLGVLAYKTGRTTDLLSLKLGNIDTDGFNDLIHTINEKAGELDVSKVNALVADFRGQLGRLEAVDLDGLNRLITSTQEKINLLDVQALNRGAVAFEGTLTEVRNKINAIDTQGLTLQLGRTLTELENTIKEVNQQAKDLNTAAISQAATDSREQIRDILADLKTKMNEVNTKVLNDKFLNLVDTTQKKIDDFNIKKITDSAEGLTTLITDIQQKVNAFDTDKLNQQSTQALDKLNNTLTTIDEKVRDLKTNDISQGIIESTTELQRVLGTIEEEIKAVKAKEVSESVKSLIAESRNKIKDIDAKSINDKLVARLTELEDLSATALEKLKTADVEEFNKLVVQMKGTLENVDGKVRAFNLDTFNETVTAAGDAARVVAEGNLVARHKFGKTPKLAPPILVTPSEHTQIQKNKRQK